MAERIFVTDAQVMAAQMLVERDRALGREPDAGTRMIADRADAGDDGPLMTPPAHPGSGGEAAVARPAVPRHGGRSGGVTFPLGRRLGLRLEIGRRAALHERLAGPASGDPHLPRPAATSFWDALDPAEQEELMSAGSLRTFAAGTALMQEGERADQVMVILGGRTKISVAENGRERVLAIRGLGQLVGERAAVKVNVRSATVTALEVVWALVLRTVDFAAFISDHPRVEDLVQDQVYARLTEAPAESRHGEEGQRYLRYDPAGTTSGPGDEQAAGHSRHSPEPLNGENCTVLLSDVVGFGANNRTDNDRRLIREALFSMTDTALQGIPGMRNEDRGDGILTVLPPSISTAEVMNQLLKELPAAIERHNKGQRDSTRIQLRLAVNVGPVFSDTMGVSGEAIMVAGRLLEAPHFKDAVHDSATSLGIIVSPFVYETVIRPGSDLSEEASYIQVPVELRESSTIAWMRLISPDLATTYTRPGANEPAASQEP
jgi:CRP-like cAMP-binding protein